MQEKLENCLTFHCLNRLFKWSQIFCKFSAFSLEFQKFFSVGQNNFGNKILWILGGLRLEMQRNWMIDRNNFFRQKYFLCWLLLLVSRAFHFLLFTHHLMSSSCLLLGVESRDFSHTEKEKKAWKAEQIHKGQLFSFKMVLGCRFE